MKINLCLIFVVLFTVAGCNASTEIKYTVPLQPWQESFGAHRAVINIAKVTDVAILNLTWRRHDRNPAEKQFIIVNAETGDTIPNIYRYHVDNENCKIAFGPVQKPGKYYFYYLPYLVQEGYGGYGRGYLKRENKPDQEWVDKNEVGNVSKINHFPTVGLVEMQSRTAFDSFYPMEIIPLASEKEQLLQANTCEYLIFPENRLYPIRMKDEIPFKWVKSGPSSVFSGEAEKNEYYVFQLGLYATGKDIENIEIQYTSLVDTHNSIPVEMITCFNTEGIDPYGIPFKKNVDVKQGNVQPFWIGIDVAETQPSGTYKGQIIVKPGNSEPQTIDIVLKVNNKVLADRGDNELWRHSRLRWLNSTLGIDDNHTKPYQPIKTVDDKTYLLTNKTLKLSSVFLPKTIQVAGTEVLSNPVSFVVEKQNGIDKLTMSGNESLIKNASGIVQTRWNEESKDIHLVGTVTLESDGYINYKISLRAKSGIKLKDIRLEIPFRADIAQYMMGMNLPGTTMPNRHVAKWKGPYDSFWVGNTHAGLWVEMRGSTYHGPLLNLYRPAPPPSWYNNDLGGFKIENSKAIVFSGARDLKENEELEFEWSMLITPVKEIDYHSQFTNRYYHNGDNPMPAKQDFEANIKIVNLHHANNYNPYLNYPFIETDSLKSFVKKIHEKGLKTKIYYTIRELTNHLTELWALRSLGYEILDNGRGGGFPWLREHLIDGYNPQWYQHFPDKSPDASIVNSPGDSRWYNYYIEGLAWLVKNIDIDGLYLDDVSYDRRTVKRIRKVLDNTKPGCIIDLHSNTGFSKGPAMQYAEFFPYMDKLWFGESFMYSKMPPENWLVEVSGIPFGLMGDMLHAGGNRWMGMVYGMTLRLPWLTEGVSCDPRPVWKIWDQFGIESSKMMGYWESDVPVKTNNPKVKATAYVKEGKTLISVANWDTKSSEFSFDINWEKLGMTSKNKVLFAPEIEDFQSSSEFKVYDKISVEPLKGWIFIIENK